MVPFGPVVARTRVTAPRAVVWEYLVSAAHRANWWSEVRFEPAVGGKIAEHREIEGNEQGKDVVGEIDVLVRGHAIGFTWHESNEPDTSVLLTLRSHGDETGVTVTETGFDALPSPAEKSAAALADWRGLLEAFTIAVEQAVADGFIVDGDEEHDALPSDNTAGDEIEADVPAEFDADANADVEDLESDAEEAVSDDEGVDADTVVVESVDAQQEAPESAEAASDDIAEEQPPGTEIEAVEVFEVEFDEDDETQSTDSEMIEVEPDEIPLVLPAPPEDPEHSETADEPDFDALVRGD